MKNYPPPPKNGAVINKAIPSFLSPNCRIPVLASAYFEVRVQFLLLPPPQLSFKVVKNLLFVAKVLYLLEPGSGDKQGDIKDDVEEQEVLGDGMTREDVGEHMACADEKEELGKPATLLWLIQKLTRIAKLEAAYSPRNPLKVRCTYRMTESSLFFSFF